MDKKLVFNDETIQSLFGFEDAESESIERLREYYFKKDTFSRVVSDLPVRILVGHKGTGKSALFKVAIAEEKEKGNLPILIKPDDIAELGKDNDDFLLKIRQWKIGLIKIIGSKVFNEFGLYDENIGKKLGQFGLKLISFITETVEFSETKIHLEATQKQLIDNFLKSKKIVIYIDDLDRGWQGQKNDIIRVSALLSAVRDMANDNPGLRFKISLRSDVYYLVRTSDESTDKIEGSVVWYKWEQHEILVLLIKRILTFFGEKADENTLMKTEQKYLDFHLEKVFEPKFQGKGKWSNIPVRQVFMSLIRKRPRDLVKLCSLAAQRAYSDNSSIIRTQHLNSVFEEYSQGRIQDTINEYKTELPSIERLVFGMKPSKKGKITAENYIYTTAELQSKINKIKQQNSFNFANGKSSDARDLIYFLYKINFLTARKVLENGTIQRKYFEENRYLANTSFEFGYDWEVHPAFRWALQPDDINGIFDNL